MLPDHDQQLWKDFQKGNREAFANIYQAHFSSLYNYAYRIGGSSSLAKDAIQQLFVKLWNRREFLSNPVSVRHYLLKSLRRTLLDIRLQQERYTSLSEADSCWHEDSKEFLIIQEHAYIEQNHYLQEALNKLSKRQREAIYLKFYEGMSYEEISSAMLLNIRTVYNLISQAIEMLRQNTPYVNLMLLLSLFLR